MDSIATLLFDILVVYQGAAKGEFAERIHKREVNQHFLDQPIALLPEAIRDRDLHAGLQGL
jgi:hypothetical protein